MVGALEPKTPKPEGWEGETAGIGLCFLWVLTKNSEHGKRRMICFKIYNNLMKRILTRSVRN